MSNQRVAIVGSGVIGASVADALAARGASVTMFDMRAPGAGASQASAGVLAPFIEATPESPLRELGARSLAMWDDFMDGVRQRAHGLDVEYSRSGTLEVALCDDDEQRLRGGARGGEHEWLDAAALAATRGPPARDCRPSSADRSSRRTSPHRPRRRPLPQRHPAGAAHSRPRDPPDPEIAPWRG